MLNHALHYRSLGLSVIPLTPGGKSPLLNWKEFQSRKASEAEVREWFTKWPTANVGIVTGSVSQIAVIDLDGPEGLKSAQELNLHSTVISNTGRGKHLWFRHSSDIQNAVRLYPGVDVRGEGGYVVAPPSVSPNGRRYRFVTPLMGVHTLPEFPTVLIQKEQLPEAHSKVKEESWIAKALEGMKNGNIDETLFTICCRLRSDGYSRSDAYAFLSPHAKRVEAELGHLEEKIENVWSRYEPKSQLPRQSVVTGSESLVIHSPANPDSIRRFEQRQLAVPGNAGLSTGFPKLDAMFVGGLKSSRLFVVGARTGVGKSNFIIGISKNVCKVGKRVLLFSTEMPYEEIWSRYRATLEDVEDFGKHEFHVCDSFAPNLEKVEQAISQIKPDVFIFDHINHISEDVRPLGEFMQGLNWLKRKYDCAGIITAQLNRSADWMEDGKKVEPRLSMIKGSGTIEQVASRVLLLSETRITPEMTEIQGIVAKNDNGTKGMIMFGLLQHPWRVEELA